jgi:hypothetical protein
MMDGIIYVLLKINIIISLLIISLHIMYYLYLQMHFLVRAL